MDLLIVGYVKLNLSMNINFVFADMALARLYLYFIFVVITGGVLSPACKEDLRASERAR